jgi:predicted nucleic acid-binding protein
VIFLDTSVLIAVAQVGHPHHEPSRDLWNFCSAAETSISAHTLTEIYSVLTSMPPGLRVSPRNAIIAIETFLKRVTVIMLSAEEYLASLRTAANLGHAGGVIYDALHLACARKISADRIYTWNVRHFQMAAPDLKDRILTP